MIPDVYHDFFLAVAGAAGALVGLLFVAISVAPERAVGPDVELTQETRASTALTALVTPLTLALIALIPDTNIGWAALVIGALGVLFVAATIRRIVSGESDGKTPWAGMSILIGFLAVMTVELIAGIRLIVRPHVSGAVGALAGAMVASLAVGIARAWALVGARDSGITTSIRTLLLGHRDKRQP